ncbi:MAG: hypothetical protein H0U30_07595 [Actinobacteria bacterium]|nr:hypothetical protein [Actinomycetota bacterium]
MVSTLIRKRTSIALVSVFAFAILWITSAGAVTPGDLDPSFGTGGKVATDFGGSEAAQALILQPNGKIVVGGSTYQGDEVTAALARYLPDGSLDPVFGGDGTVTLGVSGSIWGLAFRPGGGVIAVGEFGAVRIQWNGLLDTTFGTNGVAQLPFGNAWDLAIQQDGKIVAVGCNGCLGNSDFRVARLNPDGTTDESFGNGGEVDTDFDAQDTPFAVAVQRDGRIVVAGWAENANSTESDFALARYNPDGSLDSTFDGDGRTTIDFGAREFAYDLAVQSDAKLVVVGQSTLPPTGNDFALARLNTDGSLDTQGLDRYLDAPFGTGGKVLTSFGDDDIATSVEIEPGGKILVAGLASPEGTDGDFGLVRYNVDGSVDSSFGTAGKVTTAMTTGEDVPWGVVVQRDGRIVVAGGSQGSGSDDFLLARYQVRGCCFIDGSPPGGPPDPGPLP